MQEPLISVVIPCYNDGRYLPETLERLSKLTYSNFEIIIVNDGSTDAETLKILDQLASQGGGIQVLHKKMAGCLLRETMVQLLRKVKYWLRWMPMTILTPSFLKKDLTYWPITQMQQL